MRPRRPHDSAVGPVLDAAEEANDQLVLLGGPALDPDRWTEFCMQQADRILAVGAGGEPQPDPGARAELHGCDLVAVGVEPGSEALAGWARLLSRSRRTRYAARASPPISTAWPAA
jgi:hypothetical protein